ncbi:helix-turn-helix domain-containing protein [Microbacterium sp. NPDC089320]|uniref:helix-turn-helix domain-containing protein n=1 Tax=Microbacterium sp. NPDC089320 TaxID=3155182 RepID=UPI0034473BED
MTSADEHAASAESEPWTQADADTVSESLNLLIETAAEQGRDAKLVSALLTTMTAFIADRGADVLAPPDPDHPERRLRPEFRARIDAVVDSLSDDETAAFLGIGVRQVRRRAHEGALYFFTVGKRRRYPAWQFDELLGVLPGLRDILRAIPEDWTPERAQLFMSGVGAELRIADEPIAPRTWLVVGLDPMEIVNLIREGTEQSG